MAKINHHNFIDTVNDMLTEAKKRGVIQLEYTSDHWSGNQMQVNEHEMKNFGTCGYLGLEIHPDLIAGSMDYARNYGTQFSVSRAYLTSKSNFLLEDLLSQIFGGKKVISFTSTTMTHSAVLPILMNQEDLIILDQQCHVSIQTATQLLAAKGVKVELIRHSNLDMLEQKIIANRDHYKRIWYMIDGVYSMYGDVAPMTEINQLMAKYPQLHLYIDDAHGMSWHGKNGSGRVFDQAMENGKTIYISTMAKGYGAMGGLAVFPDEKWYQKVILHGGPLAYSHPIPPPMMGASIASAHIHLSDEIYLLQHDLKKRLNYTNELLAQTNLPILSYPETPIYFIGTGQPAVGYNLNKRMLDEGFYVNIGMFPAVPVKNTGLRFTITNHINESDIKAFVEAIVHHYPLALEEESRNLNDVRKAFGLPLLEVQQLMKELNFTKPEELTTTYYSTIEKIDPVEWNNLFAGKGNFDWDCLRLSEAAFVNNARPEENWDFHYLIVRNQQKKIIAATFLTGGLMKDDLLSPVHVSAIIEEKRQQDPYYLCSRTLMMGSLLTEGDHLYLDRTCPDVGEALDKLVNAVLEIQEEGGYNSVVMRDFDESDELVAKHMHDAGFFKINCPDSNIIEDLQREPEIPYIELLTSKARRNIRYEVIKHFDHFGYEVKQQLTEAEINIFYSQFLEVVKKNAALNIFPYPTSLFKEFNHHDNFEFHVLTEQNSKRIASILVAYQCNSHYFPIIIGLDQEINRQHKSYKHMLYRVALYARKQRMQTIHLGLSADTEKKKLGAKQIGKVGFMTLKDQYNLEIIDKI